MPRHPRQSKKSPDDFNKLANSSLNKDPLLPDAIGEDSLYSDEGTSLLRPEDHALFRPYTSKWEAALSLSESWALLQLSLPVIASYLLQNSLQTISVIIVGRCLPGDLSVAAFSYMFATCSGWLIGQGGSTALDTLASVAFTGGINKYQPGILLQRSFVVLTLFFIPICIIWFYSEAIFLVLGQDKQLSHDSAKFLTYLIPGGFGYIYFELMKKYLQSQGIIRPSTYVMLIVSPLNGLFNYLFINTFNVGLMGAPIATGICYWIAFILLTLYTGFVQGHECWGGWNRSCLKNLDAFSRIAALGIIQLGTEFWAFEIIALVAGRLGSLPLAGQSVLMTADQVIVTIPFGIGVATSFRVGNVLGSQDAAAARRVARTSVTLSVAVAGLILSVLVIGRNHLGKLFTTDPEVVQYVAGVLPWVGLFQLADALNGSCGGILRGMGKQRIGAAANLISYYVVALPLGSHMAFRGLELSGLWIGQCIGMGLVGMLELLFVLWTDWEQEVTRALDRIKEDEDEPGSQQDLLT